MNQVYNCLITHIEIVGRLIKVWVQHNKKNAHAVREAISSIKTKLEYGETPASVDQCSRGTMYYTRFTDGEFYRCSVIGRSSSSPTKLNVVFIDYGNTLSVNISDIRSIGVEIKNQIPILTCPGQATHYYLSGVSVKSGSMTERELEWLKSVTLNVEFPCYMYEGSFDVRMISILLEPNFELSNLLIQKSFVQMVSKEELCIMAKDMMQYSANVSSYPPPNVTVTVQSGTPRYQVPQASNIDVSPPQSTSGRKPSMPIYQPPPVYQHHMNQQHSMQQRIIVPKDKLVNFTPFPTTSTKKVFDNTITVGNAYLMYVSHVEDGPLQFTLQLKPYADDVLPYLSVHMNKLPLQNFTTALAIGMIVIGMHQPDKTLRRAMIISAGSNTCGVYYVDLGSSENLQHSYIFQLPNILQVTQLPPVATSFALKGIESGQVTDSMKVGFRDLVMSKVVLAKVMTEGPVRTCDLFVDGRDVRTLLANFNQPLQYLRQFPPRDKDKTVLVSYVEGPQQIFVQYKNETATLVAIEETLSVVWSSQREITNVNDLTIGKPVLSLFTTDNHWYRAQVMEISPNQTITVLYVDYGNKEYVNVATLREISQDLVSKWRCQAVECCLVGFDCVLPSETLAEKLEERILSAEVTLRVHSLLSADRLLVDLIDSTGNSVAVYLTEIHNACLAEAQSYVPSVEPTSNISWEPSAPPYATNENKPEKDKDQGEKAPQWVPGKKDESNKWKGGKEWQEESSNKWKSKDSHGDSTSGKWKYDDSSSGRWKQKDSQEDSSGRWKPRDSHDDSSNRWKQRDAHDDSSSSGRRKPDDSSGRWKPKDSNDDSSGRWKPKDSNDDSSGRWKPKDSNDDPSGRWRAGDNSFKRKDRWGEDSKFKNKEDSSNKWKGKNDREDGRGKWNRDDRSSSGSDGKKNDWKPREPSKKWEDDGRKGRGEFKWKENKSSDEFESKKTSTTLYSDAPGKSVKYNSYYDGPESMATSEAQYNPKVKEYVGWKLDDKFPHIVTLSHMDSPDRFYVRAIEADPELDRLRDLIDSDSYAKSRLLPQKAILVGTPVLATYPVDGELYRAVIEKVNNSKSVEVLFVDYGNRSEVATSDLYYPQDELARLPMSVLLCCLSDVKPVGGSSWTTDTGVLVDCFGGESQLSMTEDSVKFLDGQLLYFVKLTVTDSGKSVSQNLVDAGLGRFSTGKGTGPLQKQESVEPISSLPVPLVEESTPEEMWVGRVELLVGQFLLSKVVSIVNTETIIVKLDAANLLVVCTSPDINTFLQTGDKIIIRVNCLIDDRLRVTIYDKGGYVLGDTKRELPQISPVCPMPITKSRFRVQVPHCEQSLFVYIQKTTDADRIAEMLDSLYAFYEGTKTTGKEFLVNSLCAVKSSDENWYRARINNRTEDVYNVGFIDYGNTEEVDGSRIRKLDNQFYFPELAFKAKIHFKWKIPVDEADLAKFVDGREFTANLIKHNIDDWYVSLEDDNSKNLVDELIKLGMAENYKENPFNEVGSVIGNDILAGNKIPVTITHVESPELFWVQMIKHVETVESIQKKLQSYVETKKDTNCGIFAAQYTADGLWYRAYNYDPNSPDTVRFIDYGNTDTITERKELSHSLTKPRSGYAVKMCLCAVPKDGTQWSQEALDMFEQFIDMDQVTAEIVSVSYKIVTDLTVDDKSISKMLVESGHAVYEDYTPIMIKNYLSIQECQVTNVFICHTSSVNDFYTLDRNREPELEELTSKLCENDAYPYLASSKIGDLVLARFPEDLSWYRATILALNPLTVRYIDFGNCSIVDDIAEIPSNVRSAPPFATHCSLSFNLDSDLAVDKFIELSDEGKNVFNMTLIQKGDPNIVKLTLDDCDVCDLLPKVQNNSVNIDGRVGFVSYFNDPTDFNVQLQDDSRLDNVVDELSTAMSFSNVENALCTGLLVAAQFPEDEAWYRAKITVLEPLTVLFYDYGNTSVVSNVKELPPDLKLIPALSYRCSLKKPDSIKNWTEAMSDEFLTLSQDGNIPFTINIIKDGNPKIISLVTESNRDVTSIICGLSKDSGYSDSVGKVISAVDPINDLSVDIDNKLVTISHCSAINDFYVVLEENSFVVEMLFEKLSNLTGPSNKDCVAVGDIVAAPNPETGDWQRARVISTDPLQVYFIDSGFSGETYSTRELPDDLKLDVVSPLAHYCSLKIPNMKNWSDYAHVLEDYLTLSIDVLKVKIHDKGNPHVVSLYLNGEEIIYLKLKDAVLKSPEVPPSTPDMLKLAKRYNNKMVYISHTDSIGSFYVHLDEDTEKLDDVVEQLSKSKDFDLIENVEIGSLVSAGFPEDGLWYRARVISKLPEINVTFIDYGNCSSVTDVKRLPECLASVPPLALHCSLKRPKDVKSWTDEVEKKFLELVSSNSIAYTLKVDSPGNPNVVSLDQDGKDLSQSLVSGNPHNGNNGAEKNPHLEMNNKIVILSHVNNLDEFYVQLLDDADMIGEVIEKLMDGDNFAQVEEIKEGSIVAAQFIDMQWHRAVILKCDSKIEVFFTDYGNTSSVENVRELPDDLKAIKSLAYKMKLKKPEGIPEWTEDMQKQFSLFKDINSLPLEILAHPSGYISLMLNDVNIYNKFTTLSLDDTNVSLVFITNCESPSSFYVQSNSTSESHETIIEKLKDADSLKSNEDLKEGDLVCAKYPEDSLWYRGKVLKLEPELSVMFVDYGFSSTVEETKELPDELKTMEPLAKRCCLAPPRCGSGWTAEACGYFLALSSSAFTMNTLEEGDPSTVDLFINGDSVTSDLLELCPVIERPVGPVEIDEDIDEDDIIREEAIFNAEEATSNQDDPTNNNPNPKIICNGIADLKIDENTDSDSKEEPTDATVKRDDGSHKEDEGNDLDVQEINNRNLAIVDSPLEQDKGDKTTQNDDVNCVKVNPKDPVAEASNKVEENPKDSVDEVSTNVEDSSSNETSEITAEHEVKNAFENMDLCDRTTDVPTPSTDASLDKEKHNVEVLKPEDEPCDNEKPSDIQKGIDKSVQEDSSSEHIPKDSETVESDLKTGGASDTTESSSDAAPENPPSDIPKSKENQSDVKIPFDDKPVPGVVSRGEIESQSVPFTPIPNDEKIVPGCVQGVKPEDN